MSFYRGLTTETGVRYCLCGCGLVAKRHISAGRFKAWRSYAAGHAPNEKVIVKIPESVSDLAYAAGIIDGEGCIYTRVYSPAKDDHYSTLIQLQIGMCSESVIQWFAGTFGGDVYTADDGEHALKFVWSLRSSNAATVLRAILPYLKEKSERAKLAIELSEKIKRNRGKPIMKEEIAERMSISNKIKAFNRNPRGEDLEVKES